MISNYEQQYMLILQSILEHGVVEMNGRTGVETIRVPSSLIVVELDEEFPILKSKKVNWKAALDEILWMMQKQSNNVKDLNSKIWDNWADEDGSIGETYGAQIRKFKQVDYIFDTLKADPSSRRAVMDMWNFADLDKMNLAPCTYSSVWNIIDGKLNCLLVQRSADFPVGVPFDTLQYAILTHLFARHLGVGVGRLTHVMADTHIYANQVEGVQKLIEQYSALCYMAVAEEMGEHIGATEAYASEPKLTINPDVTNFYDFKFEDIQVVDYKSMPSIKFEITV